MLRKLAWLLTGAGFACFVWILYSWWVLKPVNPYFFLGVFVFLLGITLLRRPNSQSGGDPDGAISPAMRRQNKQHKSWIQNDRE